MILQLINILGLLLNIIGVVLLFYHGMPPKYNEGYAQDMPDDEYKQSKKYSKKAFWLIIFGFIFQLFSASIPLIY